MKPIWKFALEVADEQTLTLPIGAKPLCVHLQRGTPCVWFEVNPEIATEEAKIYTVGTGHWPPGNAQYIGSYQHLEGYFVGHVYIEVQP